MGAISQILYGVFRAGRRGLVPAPSASDVSNQRMLRADGAWGDQPAAGLPSQTGNADKLLSTDGTNATWRALSDTPIESRVIQGDVTRALADILECDGATSGRTLRVVPGAAGAIAGLPVSILIPRWRVQSSNPAAAHYHFSSVTSTGSPASQADALFIMQATATLRLTQNSPTGNANQRELSYATFRTDYADQWVDFAVVVASPNTATKPAFYIRGVDKSSSFADNNTGTPPNWLASTTASAFWQTWQQSAGRFSPFVVVLGALSADEVREWSQTGRLPRWCEIGTGSAVALTSGSLVLGRKYRITAAGGTFTGVGSADNDVGSEFVATGTAPTWGTGAVISLGPVIRPVIRSGRYTPDLSGNRAHGVMTAGVQAVTEDAHGTAHFSTTGSANVEIGPDSAGVVPVDAVLESVTIKNTTVNAITGFSIGSSAGGAQVCAATNIPANGTVTMPLTAPVMAALTAGTYTQFGVSFARLYAAATSWNSGNVNISIRYRRERGI